MLSKKYIPKDLIKKKGFSYVYSYFKLMTKLKNKINYHLNLGDIIRK